MAQGSARNKEKTIELLSTHFKMGCSVTKACKYGGIPQSTVQTWIDADEELRLQITIWQNEPNTLARANWIAKMAEGDYNSSKEWLSKKEKDEFSDRTEHTGAEGGAIEINTEQQEAIDKALNDM